MRGKAGFSLDADTRARLRALSFVRGVDKSTIVEFAIAREVEAMRASERIAFEAALKASKVPLAA